MAFSQGDETLRQKRAQTSVHKSFESSERILKVANETEKIQIETAKNLEDQKEKLKKISEKNAKIGRDVKKMGGGVFCCMTPWRRSKKRKSYKNKVEKEALDVNHAGEANKLITEKKTSKRKSFGKKFETITEAAEEEQTKQNLVAASKVIERKEKLASAMEAEVDNRGNKLKEEMNQVDKNVSSIDEKIEMMKSKLGY